MLQAISLRGEVVNWCRVHCKVPARPFLEDSSIDVIPNHLEQVHQHCTISAQHALIFASLTWKK